MREDFINVGKVVEEDGEKKVLLDFDVYLHLFVEGMQSAGVREDLIGTLIFEFQKGQRTKKKRIRHKRIKQVADLMFAIMIAVDELEREKLLELNIIESL